MKRRYVWVIEWFNLFQKWETWEIYGPKEEKICRRNLRRHKSRKAWKGFEFRLLKYRPIE